MTNEAHLIASELVTKGLLVCFRVLKEEVIAAPADEAEFGLRLLLKFVPEQGEEIFDEDEVAKNTAEWGAFGFVFVVATRTCCHLISLDITQCHERTVPKLSTAHHKSVT